MKVARTDTPAPSGGLISLPTRTEDWRVLGVLGPYRLLLVATLYGLYRSGLAPDFFDLVPHAPFSWGCLIYALAAAAFMLMVVSRTPRLHAQAHLQFGMDLLMLTLLVYVTGGVSSGLGVLILTPLVGCSMVLTPRMAVVHAAAATLAIFLEEGLRQIQMLYLNSGEFSQAGLLGMAFFASALVTNLVAQRARRSEAVAERVGSEFVNLSRLNENIIEAMQTGVLVVDATRRIRTVNAASRRLLGEAATTGRMLDDGLPRLARRLRAWQAGAAATVEPYAEQPGGRELIPRFTHLGWGDETPVLILIEDAAQLREQAQQMKLAALGRLSVNIAHEIRNPLAAITQAGQLLAESPAIAAEDRRLLDMVQRHSLRIDRIVRDVLDLSRRDPSRRIRLDLQAWLRQTIAVYQESTHRQLRIDATAVPAGLEVMFDPDHLQQVLFNLLDNACAHGGDALQIRLAAGTDDGVWLDVADNGPGIPAPLQDRVFEPFFTTHASGTGIGLYLSRELCEYNQARLSHRPQAQGACFRITFTTVPPAAA